MRGTDYKLSIGFRFPGPSSQYCFLLRHYEQHLPPIEQRRQAFPLRRFNRGITTLDLIEWDFMAVREILGEAGGKQKLDILKPNWLRFE